MKERTGSNSMSNEERKPDMTREKYESLPLATLKELAKARKMRGISGMKKGDLIEAMLALDEQERQKAASAEAKEEVKEEATKEKVEKEETKEPTQEEIIQGLLVQLDKAKNDVARAYADTENMKKRLQKEADTAKKYRFQQAGLEILPILDSMELALKVESEDEAIKNYVKGFEMIHKQLVGVLENEGVKPIEALNKPFDHNTMQALMQEAKEGVEPGIVIEVLQKGYMLKDRILRPALVKVSE